MRAKKGQGDVEALFRLVYTGADAVTVAQAAQIGG
jgi:hypothetical protein